MNFLSHFELSWAVSNHITIIVICHTTQSLRQEEEAAIILDLHPS